MTPVFLDTGYILALELANDQHHRDATEHWASIAAALPPLVTTTFVVGEVLAFFNTRGYHEKAILIGSRILESRGVDVVSVDRPLFDLAWSYFQRHDDKRYSMTDCISFIVMQQRGIVTALTFDKHFRQAQFQTEPTVK
ncbi:MAG: type II toxin-antitoxin system VapC family toxin [Planctomycetaceae bacterium]